MNPAAPTARHEEEPAEILIPPVGFWRDQRTKTFLLFRQNYCLFQRAVVEKRPGLRAALSWATYQIAWWLLVVPAMGVAVLGIFAAAFLLFSWNRDNYRHQVCQPTMRINRVGNRVVVGIEAWSVFLHPALWCLRSVGSDWVICHSTAPSDEPFYLLPKQAIPAEWASRLADQLEPKAADSTAAA